MYTGLEKRKYPRLSHQFMVRYWLADNTGEVDLSQLKDISLGGARFTANRPFDKDTKLALKIRMNCEEIIPTCRVLESRPLRPGNSLYDTRLEFSNMNANDKQMLSQTLDNYLKDNRVR